MNLVLCKSVNVAAEIKKIDALSGCVSICLNDFSETGETPRDRLTKLLRESSVQTVLYEEDFVGSVSLFRQESPDTAFVVISGRGEEETAADELRRGAQAILFKPVIENDARGVMSLVNG